MTEKPNILFLLNDHQAYYRHGWDGGPAIQRPNFDRLAAGGATFNRAYSTCPLCGPVRRSMLTGLYPHNHGEFQNDVNHPFDRQTYYGPLDARGYRNFYFGKWHSGPGTAHDHGCEGFNYPSYNNPYTKPEYKDYLESRGLTMPEIIIERNFEGDKPANGDTWVQGDTWCNEHMSGVMQGPDDAHEAFFLANLACDQLRELASSDSDRPFSLRVDFWGPHQPYFPTQRFADMYRPEDIPEYGSFRSDLSGKPEIYRHEANAPMSTGGWPDGRLIYPNPLPWSEWQKTIALCYAQITQIDAAGGRILDTLEELGLADNTLVIWVTDHGDALASHGGHFDKRSYMPEEMVRVPMAVRYPGAIAPGQTSDDLVGSIDLPATILDAAGAEFEREIDGRSLMPLVSGGQADWREDLMCETHGHCDGHVARLIVTDKYKYIANRGDLDELYDLQADPYEMTNLIDHPDHQEVVADMKRRLSRWQSTTGDKETDLA